MTTLALADGAQMLGIHPKTLRHWLKQAQLPLAAHPMDARIRCVTMEHLQQVARFHGRPLQPPITTCPVLPPPQQAPPLPGNEAEHLHPTHVLPSSCSHETDLIQKLSRLETQVATLQEHLARLALALLQEQDRTVERRLSALETILATWVERPGSSASLPVPPATGVRSERTGALPSAPALNPAEQRARSRRPALIEYAASGTYVIVSSQEGELSLLPDSPAWFEWLATLSSFRFVGQFGRFTAYRESDRKGPTRSWTAHRSIHQQRYKYHIGVTDRLTITWLEEVAAKFHEDADAR